MIRRKCAEPGCLATPSDHGRCSEHSGRDIYGGAWKLYSAQRRLRERCALEGMGRECGGGLTVDHGSMRVLCRVHHASVEAERKR